MFKSSNCFSQANKYKNTLMNTHTHWWRLQTFVMVIMNSVFQANLFIWYFLKDEISFECQWLKLFLDRKKKSKTTLKSQPHKHLYNISLCVLHMKNVSFFIILSLLHIDDHENVYKTTLKKNVHSHKDTDYRHFRWIKSPSSLDWSNWIIWHSQLVTYCCFVMCPSHLIQMNVPFRVPALRILWLNLGTKTG